MFTLNIQTLSLQSDAVVLSLAITKFYDNYNYDFTTDEPCKELVKNTRFIKFNVKEQVKKYHRSVSDDTITFWKNQPKDIMNFSFVPSSNDYLLEDGLNHIKTFIESFPKEEKTCFIRGAFGQVVFINLCNMANVPLYFNYMETKTAITCLKNVSHKGRSIDPKEYKWYKPFNPVCESILDVYDIMS